MASHVYDAIVVGLGAMGSATVAQLARRGLDVLGIDQFEPPHTLGSSHGATRIIREAYFEHPSYVPLVQRAYSAWRELEVETGQSLLTVTGGLMLGRPDGEVISGALASAAQHALPHDLLDATQLRHRYPQFRLPADAVGVLEPRAGILAPEKAIAAFLGVAREKGATLRTGTPMLTWEPTETGVIVRTPQERFAAKRLVLSLGAYVSQHVTAVSSQVQVQRNVLYWFDAAEQGAQFGPSQFPVFIHEISPGLSWYGFPDTGAGIKVGLHQIGDITSPAAIRRTVDDAEVAAIRAIMRQMLPHANGALRATSVCMYTNAPDFHFVIDTLPDAPQVVLASPCSGHGFKFASALGEVLADLVMEQKPGFDLSLFRLARFRE
jgi:sarcosine oxidase